MAGYSSTQEDVLRTIQKSNETLPHLLSCHKFFMSQESKESRSVSGARGNTSNPGPRSRQWICTVNNWIDGDMSQLSRLSTRSTHYIIGKEVGESGTPHLQCYFKFKNQTRFSTLKKAVPRAHWEKAKGSAQDNLKYCSKDGDFQTNIEKKWSLEEMKELVRAREYANVTWKEWQQDVLDLIAQDSGTRTVFWIYEKEGNTGKSFLTKYLVLQNSAILTSGKSKDILYTVAKAVEAGILPELVIFDVPRVSSEFISFQAIESIKNGCAHSGKYECVQLTFPIPTVICFANCSPPREKLSKDRWVVYEIKDDKLYEKLYSN